MLTNGVDASVSKLMKAKEQMNLPNRIDETNPKRAKPWWINVKIAEDDLKSPMKKIQLNTIGT